MFLQGTKIFIVYCEVHVHVHDLGNLKKNREAEFSKFKLYKISIIIISFNIINL